MTTRADAPSLQRRRVPCPTCGKPKTWLAEVCKACRVAEHRAVTARRLGPKTATPQEEER